MPNILVKPRAQVDIDDALAWYRSHDSALPARFLAELDAVFDRISQNPRQFPVAVEPIQRALLRRFPYSVYFIVGGSLAAIVAVVHQRREPVDWKARGERG